LKIYGDAPVTVSVSIVIVADATDVGVACKFGLTKGKRYVNLVVVKTLATFVEIL
jgi:hypothetical protein